MKARFVISYKANKLARGIFFLLSDSEEILFQHLAESGSPYALPTNNGPLPEGEYTIDSLSTITSQTNPDDWQSFTLQNYGWFASITPLFITDRSNLGLHPDGGVEGSRGCIVQLFEDIESNVQCHNLIRDGLVNGKIPLTVMMVGRS